MGARTATETSHIPYDLIGVLSFFKNIFQLIQMPGYETKRDPWPCAPELWHSSSSHVLLLLQVWVSVHLVAPMALMPDVITNVVEVSNVGHIILAVWDALVLWFVRTFWRTFTIDDTFCCCSGLMFKIKTHLNLIFIQFVETLFHMLGLESHDET